MSLLNRSYSSSGAGRVLGTVYQNTSALYPLLVVAHCSSGAGWPGGFCKGEVGPTSGLGSTPFSETPTFTFGQIDDTAFFFVPANYFYKVTGGSLVFWQEYQILTATLNDSGDLGPSGSNTRALATTYTNSGSNGIVVMVVLSGATIAGQLITGTSNSGATYKLDLDAGGIGGTGVYSTQTARLFVPAGATYSVASSGGYSISTWHEYDIGCSFTDPGDQSSRFAINNITQNTGTAPWFVEVPASVSTAGNTGGIGLLTDSSNPPTTQQASQWKRAAGAGFNCTVTGVVMPSEYAEAVLQASGGGESLVLDGSPRLYALGGIPFASAPILTYQNP